MKVDKMPSNAHEFSKVWKTVLATAADRYRFLLRTGSQRLGQIFHNEISFGLLGEIITVLSSEFSEEDSSELLAMLHVLSTTNRFSLSLQFLDKSERHACSQLLQQLRQAFIRHTDEASQQSLNAVNRLMSVYGCDFS